METALGIEASKQFLLSIGLLLAAGTASGVLAQKLKVPDIVFFLIFGILLGPEVMGFLNIKAESPFNQLILIFGSCYILFDCGASLRISVLKEVWITVVTLATAGVLMMTAVTGIAASSILGIPFVVALLLGATIASTDPASLVPIFKQIKIKSRVSHTVMSESAFNDAVSAIVTFAVLAVATGDGEFSVKASLIDLLKQSAVGLLAGSIMGYIASLLIAHEKYAFLSEYAPVVTLMAVIGTYLGADGLRASGFMAVFAFGIVMGNKESFGFRISRSELGKFDEYIITTAFIMRMFIFILLGSQVDFALIRDHLFSGMVVVGFFMFIARPLTVFVCALPDRRARWSFKEMLFMCWTRETGVIPAALAGILLGMNAPGGKMIASVTFMAILMTIIIQATTTKWLARKLDLLI